ncbi:MAG: carbohydrate kinase family protein [Veillonella sp.]|uniref:carbohydrate kinase family protein n=1 Tax=Veillonella sp. TaxID=1926307 RepID=UPI00258091D5|nr:PfkB family carbohydrate kinase [Veillonella sp.]MBS6148037.1 carbohydrate kinase family protein [Veillonella sp.]MBS6725173.1 carbohydrate kinase family protein [Veillonella sp.]MBS6892769.1 carbohydrate kinase family protein [Veillonella sp.]MDU7875860.1 PfkB family carbohydrate kinase [Veillonella sp.]MDU7936640.1 PfkB family carbohydrate kinase [Veillonella sp.]
MNAFPNEVIDIVGIGASTLDRFIVVDHFPTGREVQQAISSTTDGGGPVATALATAGKYGSRTVMIDRIGDDMVGRYILEDFHKYNVNTEGIQVDAEAKSGTATILVKQKTGERAVFFERSTASDPEFLDNYQGLIENASIVHINGRHRHLMRTAIDIARQSGTIISLDGGAQRYDDDMRPITELSHVVIVARDYAEKYTGSTNLEEACCIIHDRGALIAGVTDGANGSYFVWPDGTAYRCQPFPQASVVDTTGAGDSFHGAFLSKLAVSIRQENALYGEFIKPIDILQSLDHKQLESAAIFASAVSALNTQGIGGRSALPSLKSACNLAGLE